MLLLLTCLDLNFLPTTVDELLEHLIGTEAVFLVV
jgi:hypothetical protein